MKSFLLTPIEIQPQTYFIDALMWIAFERYPTDFIDINSNDDKECLSDFEEHDKTFSLISEFFTKEVCEKYGLPENIERAYYEKNKETPTSLELIESVLKNEKSNVGLVSKFKSELPEAIDFDSKRNQFFDAVNKRLQEAKHRLYAAIKESRLRLYGIERYVEGEVYYAYRKDFQFDQISPEKVNFERLEIEGLNPAQLLCEDRDKKHKGTYFDFLMVSTEDLFKHFPPKQVNPKQIKCVQGAYVLDDAGGLIKQSRLGGRKPELSDNELMEIAVHLTQNADKYANQNQKYIVYSVIEWFYAEFGRIIAYETMRGRIAEFLKTLKTKTEL